MATVLALLGVSAVLVALARSRRAPVRPGGATVSVVADDDGVRRVLADGRNESVAWDAVEEVSVFTTKVGPHAAAGGAVVLYGDETHGCVVPLDQLEASALFAHVGRLPGFEARRLIDAVGHAVGAADDAGPGNPLRLFGTRSLPRTTVVWQRTRTDGPAGS